MDIRLSKFREIVKDMEAWHAAVHGVSMSWTGLSEQQQMQNMRLSDGVNTTQNIELIT